MTDVERPEDAFVRNERAGEGCERWFVRHRGLVVGFSGARVGHERGVVGHDPNLEHPET